jgi:hypothetical protein
MCTSGGGCHPVLARTRLGDHTLFAHPQRQQRLAQVLLIL